MGLHLSLLSFKIAICVHIVSDLIMESTKAPRRKKERKKKKKKLWKKHVYDQDREYRTGFNYGVNKGTKGNDGTDGTNGTEEKKGLWKKPVYGKKKKKKKKKKK